VHIGGSGHRLLPPPTMRLVRAALRKQLTACSSDDLSGMCCLADGGDYLFAEAILAVGGTLDVVVPSAGYREALPEDHWREYDRLLAQARSVVRLPYLASTSDAHMAASRYIVDHADQLIAIWDGQPARAYGGTADVVAYARERGVPVTVVWPAGASRD
jgi:hypothetical protein